MRARLAVRAVLNGMALMVVTACGGEADEAAVTTDGASSAAERDAGSAAGAASFCSDVDELFRQLEASAEPRTWPPSISVPCATCSAP